MKGPLFAYRLKHFLNAGISFSKHFGRRTLLSQAYQCEEAWNKRLESPLIRDIQLDKHFFETDKKFGTKNLASGVDIDLFACAIQDANHIDELEHLLYEFRKTKRANEMIDSTISAVVRLCLKHKDYESLFRILQNQENYGIFPDLYLYNMLLDNFIEEKLYKEAVQVAILMMLQEDFSNEISSFLAVYSCHLFLKNNSLDSLFSKPEDEEKKEDEDEEEQLERVAFFRNPWFDDHFDLTEPRHLIGKTLFLAGRQMKDEVLSKTFQLVGLGMYEKWDKVLALLESIEKSETPVLLSEGIEEFNKYIDTVSPEDMKLQFEGLIKKLQENGQIKTGKLEEHLTSNISKLSALEAADIKAQHDLFKKWERQRQVAHRIQTLELGKQQKLEEIAKKKEYLFWKEKLVYFFENEDRILEEFKQAEEVAALVTSRKSEDEVYIPPEISNQPTQKLTKYQKLAKIKKL